MLLQRPGVVGLRMGINGVWGNMGIAVAPLITGILLLFGDWRLTFVVPVICIIYGIIFYLNIYYDENQNKIKNKEVLVYK